ncbi:MAG: TspO/MBR family protein [Pseudomonadota bacterium]
MDDWTLFLVFVGANVLVAASGAVFMPGEWYKTLNKPSWTPPDWLFAPAWTLLYAMIAYSGYRFTLAAPAGEATVPLVFYGLQLIFNGAWSALFFGVKRIDLALIDAGLMFAAIAITIALFAPVSTLSALLLLPYLAWVGFATALNYSIMRRNASARSAS